VFLRVRDTALLGRLLRFNLDDSFRLSHRFLLPFLAHPYLSSYIVYIVSCQVRMIAPLWLARRPGD
jgi:hypothetical protein